MVGGGIGSSLYIRGWVSNYIVEFLEFFFGFFGFVWWVFCLKRVEEL